MKARCWFEEEPRADFIRNIAPWDADDLDADRSRGLRLDSERPLIKVLPTAASGRALTYGLRIRVFALRASCAFGAQREECLCGTRRSSRCID